MYWYLAIKYCPCPRNFVSSTNEIVDGDSWLVEINLAILFLKDGFVSSVLLHLNNTRRFFRVRDKFDSLVLYCETNIPLVSIQNSVLKVQMRFVIGFQVI